MAGLYPEYRESCSRSGRISRHHLREIGSPIQERIHRLDDGTNVPFRTQPADAGLSGFIRQLSGDMNGDHEDGNLGEKLRDPAGNFNAVEIGHLEVEQDHIRRIFLNPLQGFRSGWSLGANPPGALLFE